MSPGAVDVPRVHATLARLRELLADLDELVGSPTAKELAQDRGRRHITERVLTQLVELAVGVNSHVVAARLGRAPGDYTESFELAADAGLISRELAAELRASAGMRNVLVHEYLDVDLQRIAEAVPRARDAYARYVAQVATFLTHTGGAARDEADTP